jgi:probable F420-dependent oxidoreductase
VHGGEFVCQNPGVKFWVSTAFTPVDQYVHLARACDEAGLHGLLMGDHQIHPRALQRPYPYSADGKPIWSEDAPWPDAFITIGAMASVTERLRFGTNVYIGPARNILTVAKSVGTAAALSGNRVHVGLGAGWMKEEFDIQQQPYETRGARLTEMVHALRALLAGGWVEHHGVHYDIPPVKIEPHPSEPVPILIGGQSDPALRRAAAHADGWIGTTYDEAAAHAMLDRIGRLREEAGRVDEPFDVIMGIRAPLDHDLFARLETRGLTGILCAPWLAMDENYYKNIARAQGELTLAEKRDAVFAFAEHYC